jgi:hypothetical protein
MPDAGCRMPDAGCRMPDAGCRMPNIVTMWFDDGGVESAHTLSRLCEASSLRIAHTGKKQEKDAA